MFDWGVGLLVENKEKGMYGLGNDRVTAVGLRDDLMGLIVERKRCEGNGSHTARRAISTPMVMMMIGCLLVLSKDNLMR